MAQFFDNVSGRDAKKHYDAVETAMVDLRLGIERRKLSKINAIQNFESIAVGRDFTAKGSNVLSEVFAEADADIECWELRENRLEHVAPMLEKAITKPKT